ncbi:MAG TPA: glycosyltransferase family 2 protein [Pseudonocardiaceae bacterium]|jgi:glycosyltransferase involved in cell wall biosynthesis|nr:glycosyltransferase family 2 protein [Pseudonocardiaceae bacterium]
MPADDTLVSIGLPVRNGEQFLAGAVRSVLAQDHHHLELVISDNASDDGTQEICREFAQSDPRVRYYRQSENIGLLNNFIRVQELAAGTYFKWLGDDDWLAPTYVSRCMEIFAENAPMILVTTQQAYVDSAGEQQTARYAGDRLGSAQPVARFTEMLRLLNESYLLLDPLYGLMRRAQVVKVPRVNMLREDETFAAKLALVGPFGHIPEVLSYRRTRPFTRLPQLAGRLGVPAWHVRIATALQCRELLKYIRETGLSPEERRQARIAVARMYFRRHRRTAVRRSRKLIALTVGS